MTGLCPVVCQFVPFAMSHLYCYTKKHKHFGVSRFREGRRSVVNTVKVIVTEYLRLHHHQCVIFSKISGITLCGLEPPFHMWRFIVFFQTVFPSKGVYYTSVRSRRPCIFELDGVWNCPLWKKNNFLTRNLWMLVGPIAGVTPLSRLQKLPRPQCRCRSGIVLRNSRCPRSVTDIRFRERNPAVFTFWSQTPYCGTKFQSVLRVWNRRSHRETP